MTTKPKRKERLPGVLALPSSVKIGSKDYKVKHVDTLIVDGDPCLGAYTEDWRLIRLHSDLKEDPWHELEVFIHEAIGHGTWAFFAMPDDIDAEEKYAEIVSKGLTMMLRDNPGLVKAIHALHT